MYDLVNCLSMRTWYLKKSDDIQYWPTSITLAFCCEIHRYPSSDGRSLSCRSVKPRRLNTWNCYFLHMQYPFRRWQYVVSHSVPFFCLLSRTERFPNLNIGITRLIAYNEHKLFYSAIRSGFNNSHFVFLLLCILYFILFFVLYFCLLGGVHVVNIF